MEPILLTERYEYEYCVARGYEPLLDIRNFRLDIRLRVEIQRELFGHCVLGRGDDRKAINNAAGWSDCKKQYLLDCVKFK